MRESEIKDIPQNKNNESKSKEEVNIHQLPLEGQKFTSSPEKTYSKWNKLESWCYDDKCYAQVISEDPDKCVPEGDIVGPYKTRKEAEEKARLVFEEFINNNEKIIEAVSTVKKCPFKIEIRLNRDICANYGEAWLSCDLLEQIGDVHPINLQNLIIVWKGGVVEFGCQAMMNKPTFNSWYQAHEEEIKKLADALQFLVKQEDDPFNDRWGKTISELEKSGIEIKTADWD